MSPAKATGSAADFLPDTPSLPALREAAAGCKGCQWNRTSPSPSTATIHPSTILRGEPKQRETELAAFVEDLRFVKSLL